MGLRNCLICLRAFVDDGGQYCAGCRPPRAFEVRRWTLGADCLTHRKLVKTYGPFEERWLADRIAKASAEKHPGDVVEVAPIKGAGR